MDNLKVVKIVNKGKTYTDKNGVQHFNVNYYLVVGDTYIAFRPSFSKGYTQLDMIAEIRINSATDEHKE